jgi:AcrR family transcriptional regulator
MVDALLRGAARVLVARGYAEATTNHIAAAAGASVGSLYEYFGDKDALFEAIARAHVDASAAQLRTCLETLEANPRQPLVGIVEALVQTMVELHAAEPALHHRLATEVPLSSALRRQVRDLEIEVVLRVTALVDGHPDVRTPRPSQAVVVCVQAIDALTHRWFAGDDADVDPDSATHELTSLVLHHLQAS